jgi:hypothetical protein
MVDVLLTMNEAVCNSKPCKFFCVTPLQPGGGVDES